MNSAIGAYLSLLATVANCPAEFVFYLICSEIRELVIPCAFFGVGVPRISGMGATFAGREIPKESQRREGGGCGKLFFGVRAVRLSAPLDAPPLMPPDRSRVLPCAPPEPDRRGKVYPPGAHFLSRRRKNTNLIDCAPVVPPCRVVRWCIAVSISRTCAMRRLKMKNAFDP